MAAERLDALIIGAGIGGLTAAAALQAAGKRVAVLEARDVVGGRTRSASLLGETVDVGGQWAGPTQTRLLRLLGEHGLETYPQFSQGWRLLELGGRLRRYRGTIPRLQPLALIELGLALARINRLARGIDLDRPWVHAQAQALDQETAASWTQRQLRSGSARALMDIASRAIFSAELHEYSALHLLTYTRNGGSFEELAEIHGGAQQSKVKGGMHQLAARMAAALGPGAVHLDCAVRAVEQHAGGLRVHHAQGSVDAARVIAALPPPLADRIEFSPALPAARVQLQRRLPMGSVVKMLIAYERPFWRERGLSGEVVSDCGPLSPVMDACIPGRPEGMLVGFFEGSQSRGLIGQSQELRRAATVQCLTRWLGPEAAHPIAYTDYDWVSDPWSQGCYAALFTPGAWTGYGPALRAPCGGLHWAGTETARGWLGYIDGAIESGERAAQEVLAALA